MSLSLLFLITIFIIWASFKSIIRSWFLSFIEGFTSGIRIRYVLRPSFSKLKVLLKYFKSAFDAAVLKTQLKTHRKKDEGEVSWKQLEARASIFIRTFFLLDPTFIRVSAVAFEKKGYKFYPSRVSRPEAFDGKLSILSSKLYCRFSMSI